MKLKTSMSIVILCLISSFSYAEQYECQVFKFESMSPPTPKTITFDEKDLKTFTYADGTSEEYKFIKLTEYNNYRYFIKFKIVAGNKNFKLQKYPLKKGSDVVMEITMLDHLFAYTEGPLAITCKNNND